MHEYLARRYKRRIPADGPLLEGLFLLQRYADHVLGESGVRIIVAIHK